MANIDRQTIGAISATHRNTVHLRIRYLLDQHGACRLDPKHTVNLEHMVRHRFGVIDTHSPHDLQQAGAVDQQVHMGSGLLHLVQHSSVNRRDSIHNHAREHFLESLDGEVLIVAATAVGYSSLKDAKQTLGSSHGRRRRNDAKTCLPIDRNVLVLQLQLQLTLDDRSTNSFGSDLRHREPQIIQGDRASGLLPCPAARPGNTAQECTLP